MAIKRVIPITVKLATTITQDGEQESFRFTEAGTFVEMNGKYYLRYLEHQEGQETPVQIKFEDQLIRLRRQGAVETNLFLDPQQETVLRYQTEYGVVKMKVTTEYLDQQLDVDQPSGHVVVKYQLHHAGQIMGTYQLELQFAA